MTDEHKTKRTFVGPLSTKEAINVFVKDNALHTNEFGEILPWRRQHQDAHPCEGSRACTHRLEPMPTTQLFGEDWLRQLDPKLTIVGWTPAVLAALKDGVVTLGFDVIGPVEGCTHVPGALPEHCWNYALYPVTVEGIATDYVLLGVLHEG
jgi:hypothetical protein